ncbi:UDP-glucose/GDP-mannose dehydrogenase family protein [Paenibacillus sp. J5C_2022]|uniref:UDP-glucose dehydrogenase family protein n=1 Tax=Paenibacillus sp. J5C2022 TaxID=2977129 RepID=UPI0021CEE1F6|nr:UDP-glucose/GDP-mannose dehydrogenase family protein [Paenibacillus sp. J5C2022]MCU6707976.1 UDP-glucose/GDP-mannose dehydrogenase family protein [Paenibacillus sp. J5C2022]
MKITVIGTGYVGLVSGVCYAEIGHEVVCVDKEPAKIDMLQDGEIPIYEPGLKKLIEGERLADRLSFTTDLPSSVRRSELIIIAVGTPPLPNGEANLSYIDGAAKEIAMAMDGYKMIAVKSTVPVGTNERLAGIIHSMTDKPFDSISLPEFLREGTAVHDTLHPDRIVIGAESEAAARRMVELHNPLTDQLMVTDIRSAEMIKYASNAFLATKISFINEIANICEKVGADVLRVAEGMGRDRRIGPSFLNAGIGYGGSCFPKDTKALIQIAGHVDYEFKLLRSVVEVNQDQRFSIIRKLEKCFDGELAGKTVAVWGLAFKPNTDDVRDTPALEIISHLLDAGARVRAYDPVATGNFRLLLGREGVSWHGKAMDAASGADALCLLTDWEEFAQVNLMQLQSIMKRPILIDGRNVFDEQDLLNTGFIYDSIGRPSLKQGTKQQMPVLQF